MIPIHSNARPPEKTSHAPNNDCPMMNRQLLTPRPPKLFKRNNEDTATAEEMKTVNFAPTVEGVNVFSLDSPQWDQSTNKSTKEEKEA